MKFKDEKTLSCDVLVIGGGGAGLRAAIAAREAGASVIIASKTRVGYANNTFISKAGFAASGLADTRDDHSVHLKDTMVGGRFINDRKLADIMVREAGAQVSFLEECSVNFRKREGRIRLNQTPGHSYPRNVGAVRAVGSEYILPLIKRARSAGVRFADKVFITRLFTRDNRIAGASGIDNKGGFLAFTAKCVILATGGYARVYLYTDNAPGITGDGPALAFDLGVPLKDMEFVQFYPTSTGKTGNRIFLYEAFVFRAGAVIRNSMEEDIIVKHGLDDPAMMTRDRLSRAISIEIQQGLDVDGGIVLDLEPVQEDTLKRFRSLLPSKWTDDRKKIIVSPTTHFCMGGVITNETTGTSVPGLYAAGEICAGVHGANRLGGNALTEVFALGSIAGISAAEMAKETDRAGISDSDLEDEKARLEFTPSQPVEDIGILSGSLKEVMWDMAGIIRDERTLSNALTHIGELRSLSLNLPGTDPGELRRSLEFRNMLLVSEMICRAALLRTESRGSHYRSDFPEEDNANWLKNILIHNDGEKMILKSVPVTPGTDKIV